MTPRHSGIFLEQLLKLEAYSRDERRRQTLLRLSGLPAVKMLEQFDFKFASGAPRAQIQELTSLAFIARQENIVFLGPSGVGKILPLLSRTGVPWLG